MGFWVLYKICAIVQAKWVFLWLPKLIFSVLRAHKIYGKIIKSRKNHFKEPLLTIEKIWNIENLKVKICLIWQCVLNKIAKKFKLKKCLFFYNSTRVCRLRAHKAILLVIFDNNLEALWFDFGAIPLTSKLRFGGILKSNTFMQNLMLKLKNTIKSI